MTHLNWIDFARTRLQQRHCHQSHHPDDEMVLCLEMKPFSSAPLTEGEHVGSFPLSSSTKPNISFNSRTVISPLWYLLVIAIPSRVRISHCLLTKTNVGEPFTFHLSINLFCRSWSHFIAYHFPWRSCNSSLYLSSFRCCETTIISMHLLYDIHGHWEYAVLNVFVNLHDSGFESAAK